MFFLFILGIEPKTYPMVAKCCTTEPHAQPFLFYFETGSHCIAQAVLEFAILSSLDYRYVQAQNVFELSPILTSDCVCGFCTLNVNFTHFKYEVGDRLSKNSYPH
jgi:hypothetical protein